MNKHSKGFTLAETLIVVAIIAILAGVSFAAIITHLRNMTKMEYDGYAKEIFIAAQNHLLTADSQGYLGRTGFGNEETEPIQGLSQQDGTYYYVINNNYSELENNNSLLNLMLPFASIDDTVRLGGNYIIRYHKNSAQVLDVLYWNDGETRYHYDYNTGDYYTLLRAVASNANLKSYGDDNSVIGYYGGVEVTNLEYGDKLESPTIHVNNAEKLTVTVNDPNNGVDEAKLKLIIHGTESNVDKKINLGSTEVFGKAYIEYDAFNNKYIIILDDITTINQHFNDLYCSDVFEDNLIPGEDIEIKAIAYNSSQITNIAESNTVKTNSLFDSIYTNDEDKVVANISNIRHLENLSYKISSLGVNIDIAKQSKSLDWVEFQKSIDSSFYTEVGIYDYNNSSSVKSSIGYFIPLYINTTLEYDGMKKSISNISINESGYAGLFGYVKATDECKIHDLELINFNVSGNNAGALVGYADDVAITNVIAYNTDNGMDATIIGVSNAGGLVGSMDYTRINRSAASLIVSSSEGIAGGLVGTASDHSKITSSYSGGHTVAGMYSRINYNVTGVSNAGGLVGYFDGKEIVDSYSTCSAKANVTGGLVGELVDGTVDNCYSTGLVSGNTIGAFVGISEGTFVNCKYYSIINGKTTSLGEDATDGSIKPFDNTKLNYGQFVGNPSIWAKAVNYDSVVQYYFKGKYNLKTVKQLGTGVEAEDFVATHYGDWPAPEILIINNK